MLSRLALSCLYIGFMLMAFCVMILAQGVPHAYAQGAQPTPIITPDNQIEPIKKGPFPPPVLELRDGRTRYNLINHFDLYIDWNKRLTLPDLIKYFLENEYPKKLDGERLSVSHGHFWFYGAITNTSTTRDWYIDLGEFPLESHAYFDAIQLFKLSPNQGAERVIDITDGRKSGLLSIAPGATETVILFIRPSAGFFFQMPLELTTDTHIAEKFAMKKTVFNGLFIAVAFLIGLSLAAQTLTGIRSYFYCVPYVVGVFLLYSFAERFITVPLDINLARHGMVQAFFLATAVFLARSFTTKFTRSSLYTLMYGGVLGVVGLYVLGLMLAENLSFLIIILFAFMPSFIFLCLAGISLASTILDKNVSASLFFAWIIPFIGATISQLYQSNIIHPTAIGEGFEYVVLNAFWISIGLNIVILQALMAWALVDKERQKTIENQERARYEREKQQMRQAKEAADQAQLVRVLKREKELMEELRHREQERGEELRLAKEIADEANSAKSAFLAVISHEIRTPMTGIMGMVRLLQDSPLNKKQKEYAETIEQSGNALLGLLNDILDFSKIESGKMDIEHIDFDVRKLIHSVSLLMEGRATEKGLRLIEDIGHDVPQALKGDPTRLRQILLNLIGNAVKFTEAGSVTIHVQVQRRMPEKNRLAIYFDVEDTGIGISKEAQEKLFNPFAQADKTITRRFGGTGLGLAICKRLVEAMQGTIEVSSEQGKGSVFSFVIPMEPGDVNAIDKNESDTVQLPPLKILIVDDNDINQKVVSGLLAKGKHTLLIASNGAEAVDQVKEQTHIDVILMDMEMPVMNGIDATRTIRALNDAKKAATPIIAMTANVVSEDMEKCRLAGMNDFTEKPINPEHMMATIAAVIAGKGSFIQRIAHEKVNKSVFITPTSDDVFGGHVFNHLILDDLKQTLGMDELIELTKDVVEKSASIMADLKAGFEKQDMDIVKHKAHDLKGMTGNFGLAELSNLALQIENSAKHNDNQTIEEMIAKTPKAIERARTAMQNWAKAE